MFFFFLTSNGHSIAQVWGGLGNSTGIEQPIKNNSLWKDLAFLAKKSENWFLAHGTWVMLKSGKHICSVSIFSNSVAKLGHVWGSSNIAISSLQSVPKRWHVECCSIFSIAHHSASTSECKADSRWGNSSSPWAEYFPYCPSKPIWIHWSWQMMSKIHSTSIYYPSLWLGGSPYCSLVP